VEANAANRVRSDAWGVSPARAAVLIVSHIVVALRQSCSIPRCVATRRGGLKPSLVLAGDKAGGSSVICFISTADRKPIVCSAAG
jgi:hypothetical protein